MTKRHKAAALILGPMLALATATLMSGAPSASARPIGDRDPPNPPAPPSEPIAFTPTLRHASPASDGTIRSDSTIVVSWNGAGGSATGQALQRRRPNGVWGAVAAWANTSSKTHSDSGLLPDTNYCYRTRATALGKEALSAVRCLATTAEQPTPVLRAEVEITTGTVRHAGTDRWVSMIAKSNGVQTYLDRPGDDFARGSTRSYDLSLSGVRNFEDLDGLRLSASYDDAICVDRIALRVNGGVVFDHGYGPVTCRWVGGANRASSIVFSRADLREHPAWRYPPITLDLGAAVRHPRGDHPVLALVFNEPELAQRIESSVGDAIQGTAGWRNSHRAEITRASDNRLHAHLELEAKVDILEDPNVDVDFDVDVSMELDEHGQVVASLRVVNVDVEAWWLTAIGGRHNFICSLLVGAIRTEEFTTCADRLEEVVETIIADRIPTISGGPSGEIAQCCEEAFAKVIENANGDVQLDFVFVLE